MQELPKYHLNPQRADALLQPLTITLQEMTARAEHYLDRVVLTPEDRAALEAARSSLAEAYATLDHLWQECQTRPQR